MSALVFDDHFAASASGVQSSCASHAALTDAVFRQI